MKNFILLVSILCGILLPYGKDYTFLIRYFLMVMLFFAFLDIKVDNRIIQKSHFVILGFIIIVSIILYLSVNVFNHELAQSVFITSIAPTAIAAPVIISLRKGKVEYVLFSLLLNNVVVSLLIPFLLPFVVTGSNSITIDQVLFPVIITISIPFIAARVIKVSVPKIWKRLVNWKDASFYILVANIYIATSDAATYIKGEFNNHLETILLIFLSSGLLCGLYFSMGKIIGGKQFKAEACQSLGQKNNAFTIWISTSFMTPLSTLGPVFYVLFQNSYITWQLYKHQKKGASKSEAD